MSNAYQNTRIEYHILQSFPVTCLNRDDVGAPKTAVVGGVTRARVSSQCWKRQVRLALQDQGIKLAIRTTRLQQLVSQACLQAGADEQQAESCGEKIGVLFCGKKPDTLLFISQTEATAFAQYAADKGFDVSKIEDKVLAKDLGKVAKKTLNPAIDGLDIALFGRMVAKAAEMNVEAASAFSHAISTHRVSNEVEFFTALDDLQQELGSAHMGSLEFSSATYYRYISLDLGQLAQTLGPDDLKTAIAAFTQALFVAVPSARQSTQSGASPWDFARVLVRRGQRLQLSFETPVTKARDGGYLPASIEQLKSQLDNKEKLCGSLFAKIAAYDWGEDSNYSIDALIQDLQSHID